MQSLYYETNDSLNFLYLLVKSGLPGYRLKCWQWVRITLRRDYNANAFTLTIKWTRSRQKPHLLLRNRYDVGCYRLHNLNRFPANNFGVSRAAAYLVNRVQATNKTVTMLSEILRGEPVCDAPVLLVCYEDDAATHQKAADFYMDVFLQKENCLSRFVVPSLMVMESPKSGCCEKYTGRRLFDKQKLMQIDSIVEDLYVQQAIPGAVVLVAKDGKSHMKSIGHLGYDSTEEVYPQTCMILPL